MIVIEIVLSRFPSVLLDDWHCGSIHDIQRQMFDLHPFPSRVDSRIGVKDSPHSPVVIVVDVGWERGCSNQWIPLVPSWEWQEGPSP